MDWTRKTKPVRLIDCMVMHKGFNKYRNAY